MTLLQTWNHWLRDLESAQIFIDMAYYNAVSSALERRVWMTGDDPLDDDCIWPNLFCLFVGPPASGKSRAMRKTGTILHAIKEIAADASLKPVFTAGPTSGSMQGIVQALSESRKEFRLTPAAEPYIYFAMMTHSEELGVLLKKNDTDMTNAFQQFYDSYRFDKKTVTADTFDLENICVNVIAATNPEWIKDSITTSLFGQGFMSRFIIVFADEARFDRDVVSKAPELGESKRAVITHLTKLSKLYGKVEFTPEAIEFRRHHIEHPTEKMTKKLNNYSTHLKHYYGRKRLHWFKLSLAMHFGETTDMMVDQPVMERAFNFLGGLERDMHKAFAKIAGNKNYDEEQKLLARVQAAGKVGVPRAELRIASNQNMDKRAFDEMLDLWLTTQQATSMNNTIYAR